MNIRLIVQVSQIVIAFVLSGLILIQGRGAGLSSTFGGSASFYRSKRGLEKVLVVITVIMALALVANSFFLVLLS